MLPRYSPRSASSRYTSRSTTAGAARRAAPPPPNDASIISVRRSVGPARQVQAHAIAGGWWHGPCSSRHVENRRQCPLGRRAKDVRGRRLSAGGGARVLLAVVDGAPAADRRDRSQARSSPMARCMHSSSSGCAGSSARRAHELARTVIEHTGSEERSAWSLAIGALLTLHRREHCIRATSIRAEPCLACQGRAAQSGIMSFIKQRILSFALVLECRVLVDRVARHQRRARCVAHLTSTSGSAQAAFFWSGFDLLISFTLATILIAMMFKYLPDAEIEWRDTWQGAVITAVLFIVGERLIGLYLGRRRWRRRSARRGLSSFSCSGCITRG